MESLDIATECRALVSLVLKELRLPTVVLSTIVNSVIQLVISASLLFNGNGTKRIITSMIFTVINLFVTLMSILEPSITEDELNRITQVITDSILEEPQNQVDEFMRASTRSEARRLYALYNFHKQFRLPNVSFETLEVDPSARFSNKWLVDTFTPEFMAMWWKKDVPTVRQLFEQIQATQMPNGNLLGRKPKVIENLPSADFVMSSVNLDDIQPYDDYLRFSSYEQAVNERKKSPDVLEYPLELDPTTLPIIHAEQQFNFKDFSFLTTLKNFVSKLVGLFYVLCTSKLTGQPFNTNNLIQAFTISREFTNLTQDFTDRLISCVSDNDPKTLLINQVQRYSKALNDFLETPTHIFAASPQKFAESRKTIAEVESFLRTIPKEFSSMQVSLNGLYQASCVRKNEILSNELPNYSRQEPFVLLLAGPGGIGKTRLARDLARHFVNNILDDGNMSKDYVEITSVDKYWPPLSGQRVAFFDEAGTVCDYKNDLLFSNLKGICSPAFFNCAAADVPHKTSPCTFQFIIATTNTSMTDIAGRIAAISSAESVYSNFRRMMVIDCSWADGNFSHTGYNNYRPDFSHLKMVPLEWSASQTKMISTHSRIDYRGLTERINRRYNALRQEHIIQLRMVQTERQSYGKIHFSVNLNGPGGNGKTPISAKMVSDLSRSFRMPIVRLSNIEQAINFPVQKKRIILYCDDLVRNIRDASLEQVLMTIYNERLVDNSVLVFCTNLTPEWNWLPKCDLNGLLFSRKHPFENIGLTRRVGYTGNFTDGPTPTYNREFFFENGAGKLNPRIMIPYKCLTTYLAVFFFLLFCIYPMTLPVMLGFLYYSFKIQYQEVISSNNFSDYVFESYNKFLQFRKQISIIRAAPPVFEENFALSARFSQDLVCTGSIWELDKHVFTNRQAYDRAEVSWKMWLEPTIAEKLRANYSRFMAPISNINTENVLRVLENYAKTFIELGQLPRMRVEIGDLGVYSYINNVIYTQDPLPFVGCDIQFDGSNVIVNTTRIPLHDVFSPERLSTIYALGLTESIALSEFVSKPSFLLDMRVVRYFRERTYQESKAALEIRIKSVKERIQLFFSSGTGRVVIIFLTLISAGALFTGLYRWFSNRREEKKKAMIHDYLNGPGDILEEIDNWSDFEKKLRDDGMIQDDLGLWYYPDSPDMKWDYDGWFYSRKHRQAPPLIEQRKGDWKRRPKGNRPLHSDAEDDREKDDNDRRKKKTKKRQYRLNVIQPVPEIIKDLTVQGAVHQDVTSLTDMNDFRAYRDLLDHARDKARRNMCMIYIHNSIEEHLLTEPKGSQACYGLFVGDRVLVTVGHIVPLVLENLSYSAYVCGDEFHGAYKLQLMRKYRVRDISVWYVPGLPVQYPTIKKQFLPRDHFTSEMCINTALERFAPNKMSQWICGDMQYWESPVTIGNTTDMVGEFGHCCFGLMGVCLTTFGDCGLPYYAIDTEPYRNVIPGIHCMGNIEGYESTGVVAIIYREDIDGWLSSVRQTIEQPQSVPNCSFCNNTEYHVAPGSDQKCEGHEVVWSPTHESSAAQFYGELRHYSIMRPAFDGLIIKNSGPRAYGSVEHSHTQFLPGIEDPSLTLTNGWVVTRACDVGFECNRWQVSPPVLYRCWDIKATGMYNCLNFLTSPDFRLRGRLYTDDKGNRRFRVAVMTLAPSDDFTQMSLQANDLNAQKFEEQVRIPLRLPNDAEVYVDENVKDIFDYAQLNLERNILPSVPFERLDDNDTVKVFGSLRQNASLLPKNAYKKTPFSSAIEDLIPIEKKPVDYDPSHFPQDVADAMVKNRAGVPDPLINQSIQWAHKAHAPDLNFRKFAMGQFQSKITRHYSGLHLLSDEEVFEGYKPQHKLYGGLHPLELEKSIGFTMKQLFQVQSKSDVIGKTPEGKYFWHENDAAQFARNFFEGSKAAVNEGKRHYSAFLELLKMEKLKCAKIHTGRTFVAQDLNGVLIERWVLGEFSARAMKYDETCGVGTNAFDDFHGIYLRLSQFKNMFTGDYKRFDRTLPYCAFQDVKTMLKNANPHLSNHLDSVFGSICERIQISGTTVFQSIGGMPSGCSVTAPLNSLINDYLIYSSFIKLASANGFEHSYLAYDNNVVRYFYGDDVILSCSDRVAGFFNMSSVSEAIMDLFGMTLDSSAKDGSRKEFETYDEASWISRFFRKLRDHQFFVGALKKISIGVHFHYTTDLTPEHLAELFTVAQWESALWEPEYFTKIQEAIRIAIKKVPAIAKHFQFRTQQDIQLQLFQNAQPRYLRKFDCIEQQICEASPEASNRESPTVSFLEAFEFPRKYKRFFRRLLQRTDETDFERHHHRDMAQAFAVLLNGHFQRGEISKPIYNYTQLSAGQWLAVLSFTHGESQLEFDSSEYLTRTKAEAREVCAYFALCHLDPTAKLKYRKPTDTFRP